MAFYNFQAKNQEGAIVSGVVEADSEELAIKLPPLISGIIFSAVREGIRNSARHGRGERSNAHLCLQIAVEIQDETELHITLEDNGIGFDFQLPTSGYTRECNTEEGDWCKPENLQCKRGNVVNMLHADNHPIFSSSGHGLALHSTLMAVVGGSLTVHSFPGQYTSFNLNLPCSVWLT